MSPRSKRKAGGRALIVSLCVSAGLLAAGMHAVHGVNAGMAGRQLIWPLARLLLFIAVGLAVGQIIEASGWTRRLGLFGAPLFRFARLGPRCSAAFTTAFFSVAAANAMLFDFWKEGKIDRFQLYMTHLANQLPAFFLHLPTTVLVVLPLTGWAGGFYFIITFAAAMLRFVTVLFIGHWKGGHPEMEPEAAVVTRPGQEKRDSVLRRVMAKLPGSLMGVATFVVPIYTGVFFLNLAGMFDWTQEWLLRTVSTTFIPIEALSLVVVSFAAEFTSGFAAAGALLREGVLTTQQAVIALLIGNVVAFPIRALRHQLPRLMGIFAPGTGLQLLLLGQGFRVASLAMVGGLYYIFF